jgi:hypothetical protein
MFLLVDRCEGELGPLFVTIFRLDVRADGWGAGGSTKTLRARSESGRGADGYGAMGSGIFIVFL